MQVGDLVNYFRVVGNDGMQLLESLCVTCVKRVCKISGGNGKMDQPCVCSNINTVKHNYVKRDGYLLGLLQHT